MFSITLVTADSYQSPPQADFDPVYSEFRGSGVKHVPVIRVFGSTPNGNKTCMHIHGVLPYMYIPCTVKENVNIYAYKLAASIDAAINSSMGVATSNNQHVFRIQVVSGIPFYGYHVKEHVFFKIYFYNPRLIKKTADLLQSGAILGLNLQPHEAHIPFLQQFMIDYNLYGMNFINTKNVKHRPPLSELVNKNSEGTFLCFTESPNTIFTSIPRQTMSEIEVDVKASDITNKHTTANGKELNPGLMAIWSEEKLRRAQMGFEEAESQLLYSKECSDGGRKIISTPTFQEERLEHRFRIIMQNKDDLNSSNQNKSLYAIEHDNSNDLLPASYVCDHNNIRESDRTIRNLSENSKAPIIDSFTFSDSLRESGGLSQSTILDPDDCELIQMLANLATEHGNVIDNDSVLGSQHSILGQEANIENEITDEEEEEDADLNITSLELADITSWDANSFCSLNVNNAEEDEDTLKNENIPQNDGTDDVCHNEFEKNIFISNGLKNQCEMKNLKKKINKHKIYFNNLNHKDLDVYDVDEILSEDNHFSIVEYPKLCLKKKQIEEIKTDDGLIIPSLDGNMNTSSESEPESDVTIVKEEKRICNYKSGNVDKVRVGTPKKRMLEIDVDLRSPKRRNMGQDLKKQVLTSPCRKLNSPQRSKNYTPLDIKISTSPKVPRVRSPVRESSVSKAASQKSIGSTLRPLEIAKVRLSFSNSSYDDNLRKINPEKVDAVKENTVKESLIKDIPTKNISIEKNYPEPVAGPSKVDESQSICLRLSDEIGNMIDIEEKFVGDTPDDEKGDDVFNTTFTQLVNEKINNMDRRSSMSQVSSTKSRDENLEVKITTKFNPPTCERIVQTINMYDFPLHEKDEKNENPKNNSIKQLKDLFKTSSISNFKPSLPDVTRIGVWRQMKVKEFHPSGASLKMNSLKQALASYNVITITPLISPPSPDVIRASIEQKSARKNIKPNERNEIEEIENRSKPSIDNIKLLSSQKSDIVECSQNSNESLVLQPGSQDSDSSINNQSRQKIGVSCGQLDFTAKQSSNPVVQNFQAGRGTTIYRYLTTLALEIHVTTRSDLFPNPELDSIEALSYCIHDDAPSSNNEQLEHGVIIVDPQCTPRMANIISSNLKTATSYVASEMELLKTLVELVKRCNPDILIGWQTETLSWGYIFLRAHFIGIKNLVLQLSRIPFTKPPQDNNQISDNPDVKIPGRICLEMWRIMRSEIALLSYTFENIMYNVIRERHSSYSFKTLTTWWNSKSITYRCRVIEYYRTRVVGTLRILFHLDIIGRTSEYAKLFGIQFYEVFSRGSQFRVESMMLRLAKPMNYIPVSPSISQRAAMRAPESLPLIMEPESKFYTDPLIVLDFQSLYPSIIIAYNYCFSTCLGRIEYMGQQDPFEFGATNLKVNRKIALKLQGKINVAPCGVAFVNQEVRKGILPRLLEEILNTRLMVKESMKLHPADNRALQRVLNSQQLGLKLIANVTYGYTAANFSGRMPCIEVGDSVVSKGRETLERAMKLVQSTPRWGARVVYGDTDSLFVLVPGKSRDEAFKIGNEIADAVTLVNPAPVKLKFEKILQPSILQTKKRYCGYIWEHQNQEKPEYFAKGIETVRRDGCPAVSKILEKSLKILFDTKDALAVKQYVVRQFDKIMRKRVSLQDLTFAKEFRGMHGYKSNACVPALELTKRLMKKDPRAIPRNSERVPYIIVAGAPNQALIQCVRTPWELMNDPGLSPNCLYYITKAIIPPLNRCLNLINVDANLWYKEMSHKNLIGKVTNLAENNQKTTICQFFSTVSCFSCGEASTKEICDSCVASPERAMVVLHEKQRRLERSYCNIMTICHSCIGRSDQIECVSLDCPVLYRAAEAKRNLTEAVHISKIVNETK